MVLNLLFMWKIVFVLFMARDVQSLLSEPAEQFS